MAKNRKNRGEKANIPSPPISKPSSDGTKALDSAEAVQSAPAAPSMNATSKSPPEEDHSVLSILTSSKALFQIVVGVSIAVATAIGTLQYVNATLDTRISAAVESKVVTKLQDYEKRTQAVERENEISRKATECYSAMVVARCNSDPSSAIAAYEDFIRHYPIDTAPETLRNILFQQLLAAWILAGKFESIRIHDVDRIAASFDHAPQRQCPSTYNNIGVCYLSQLQLEKSRAYFLQALSVLKPAARRDEEEIEIAVVGLVLASLSDSKRGNVQEIVGSSIQTLDNCETIIPVSYAQIHARLEFQSSSQLLTHLRINNQGVFSDSFSELLREIMRRDSVKDVIEDGIHFLRGTVKINGKDVRIDHQLSPLDLPKPGDRPRNGEKPRDMKKEDLDRLKRGC